METLIEKMYHDTMAAVKIKLEDIWEDLTTEGQAAVEAAGHMLVTCALKRAAGEDVSVPERALRAAIGNWTIVGMVRASVGDEILGVLKAALITGLKIVLQGLTAGWGL